MTAEAPTPAKAPSTTAYWVLRVMESALLLVSLAGIGMFAWSLVDIIRIETAAVPTKDLPPSAWPGIFLFVGCMALLQVVRTVLVRYRREDGTPRGDARGAATATTAEVLASLESEPRDETVSTGEV